MTAPLDAGYQVQLTDLDVIRNRAHLRGQQYDHYSTMADAASVPGLIDLLKEARAVLVAFTEWAEALDAIPPSGTASLYLKATAATKHIDDALGRRA